MNHPLALIVYNRPEKTARVIDALRPQKPEPLHVYVDGPTKWGGEEESVAIGIKNMLTATIDWTEPIVFGGVEHVGLAGNVVRAVDNVLMWRETVIVLEDDCIPGPWFYEFMCECLDRYPGAMAVTGYTPIAIESKHDVYFSPRMETWGWGTRKRAWKLYERDVAAAYERAVDSGLDLKLGGADLPGYMKQAIEGKDVWSAGWQLAAYLNEGLCVYPTESHVRNIGLDGTGVHCGEGEDRAPLASGRAMRFPKDMVVDDTLRGYYG